MQHRTGDRRRLCWVVNCQSFFVLQCGWGERDVTGRLTLEKSTQAATSSSSRMGRVEMKIKVFFFLHTLFRHTKVAKEKRSEQRKFHFCVVFSVFVYKNSIKAISSLNRQQLFFCNSNGDAHAVVAVDFSLRFDVNDTCVVAMHDEVFDAHWK